MAEDTTLKEAKKWRRLDTPLYAADMERRERERQGRWCFTGYHVFYSDEEHRATGCEAAA